MKALNLAIIIVLTTSYSYGATIFDRNDALNVELSADLQPFFQQVFANTSEAKQLSTPGVFTFQDENLSSVLHIPVEIKVRGNTSLALDECSFPKLKMKPSKEAVPKGSTIADNKEIKIATHCGENDLATRTPKNRIANQISPLRESYIYKIFEITGTPAQKSRLVIMNYKNLGLQRYNFLLEDEKIAAKRLNGTIAKWENPYEDGRCIPGDACTIPQKVFLSAKEMNVDLNLLARTFIMQAMVGNYDWGVRVGEEDAFMSLWNTEMIEGTGGKNIILATDFDLATAVTGKSELAIPRELPNGKIAPKEPLEFNIALVRLNNIKKLFGESVYEQQLSHIWAKAPAISELIKTSSLDAEGRNQFNLHIKELFRAAQALKANTYVIPEIEPTEGE
ncbi:hypothetical protein [Bdellovibrio sp. HCB209]|uniref:hypothetical protein n=1 Tax=Bdellovibrio sp. HCB209 TaxID=3394354 RepID=UPI0039B3D554